MSVDQLILTALNSGFDANFAKVFMDILLGSKGPEKQKENVSKSVIFFY